MGSAPGEAPRSGRAGARGVVACVAAVAVAGCGVQRLPTTRARRPIEVAARIDAEQGGRSRRSNFGAGVVTFTVANLSDSPIRLALSGPKTRDHRATIQPGEPGSLEIDLQEGDYRASVEGNPRPNRELQSRPRAAELARTSCCCPSRSAVAFGSSAAATSESIRLELRPRPRPSVLRGPRAALSELFLIPVRV